MNCVCNCVPVAVKSADASSVLASQSVNLPLQKAPLLTRQGLQLTTVRVTHVSDGVSMLVLNFADDGPQIRMSREFHVPSIMIACIETHIKRHLKCVSIANVYLQ